MQPTGRIALYTDEKKISRNNVISVLQHAMAYHNINANRIQYLLDYEAGVQPLQRKKKTRPDIDCQCVDNVANEVTEFNLGFKWGNPITLVQNGSGKGEEIAEAVTELNSFYDMAKIKAKTQELGRFVEIGGVGYVYIDNNEDWQEGKSCFIYAVLDPRTAFVVRSNYYPDHRPMLGVTFRHDSISGNNYFTCFTDGERFEIENLQTIINGEKKEEWQHSKRSGEINPFGIIPIVEYIRSYDRMGCFERQIPEMDNLNLMVSDFSNDVDQNTQAIWHSNDVEFPTVNIQNEDGTVTETTKKPGTNEWVMTYTSADGKQPSITPLTVNYDYSGMLNNIVTRRQLILQKCNVPQRNDNSGGSTGVAMSDATGWSQAETAAAKQQLITDSNKMEEVEVILAVINNSANVPQDSPLRKLTVADVQPNIKRQKTYEMTTKANAMATLLSHGIYGEDVLNAIPFFDDPNEVWQRSKEIIEKYQASIFDKSTDNEAVGGADEQTPNADRIMSDLSDQVENSPIIDKSRTDK